MNNPRDTLSQFQQQYRASAYGYIRINGHSQYKPTVNWWPAIITLLVLLPILAAVVYFVR